MAYAEILNWSTLLEHDPEFDAAVPTTGFIDVDGDGQFALYTINGVGYHLVHVLHMEHGEFLHTALVPADIFIHLIPGVEFDTRDEASAFVSNRHEIILFGKHEQRQRAVQHAFPYRVWAFFFLITAILLLLTVLMLYRTP